MLSRALTSAGWDVQVVDSSRANADAGIVSRIRPLVAWKIGRTTNKLAVDADVIVCNGYFSWNARRSRSAVVYHGTELGRALATKSVTGFFRNGLVRVINARLDKKTGSGRKIIAVSDSTGREIEELYGLKVDAVIPNAVDLNTFSPVKDRKAIKESLGLPLDSFLILYVGPPDPRKGFDFIVNELAPMLDSSQRLVTTTRATDPSNKILQVGRVDPQKVVRYYQACDAMVMPSLYEGCSYVLIEALACGLPCVVASVGAARNLAKNDTLSPYVMSRLDAAQYAERLRLLQSSSLEWTEVSAASRKHAESTHGLQDFERKYLAVVEEVAGARA